MNSVVAAWGSYEAALIVRQLDEAALAENYRASGFMAHEQYWGWSAVKVRFALAESKNVQA